MRVSIANFFKHGLLIFPLFIRILDEFIRYLRIYSLKCDNTRTCIHPNYCHKTHYEVITPKTFFLLLLLVLFAQNGLFSMALCRETRESIHQIIRISNSSNFYNNKMDCTSWWWRKSDHRIPNDLTKGWNWDKKGWYHRSWDDNLFVSWFGEKYQLHGQTNFQKFCIRGRSYCEDNEDQVWRWGITSDIVIEHFAPIILLPT